MINSPQTIFLIMKIFSVCFLTILFLQSGLDKVIDRKENLNWLRSHFANSPLKNNVPILFLTITIIELLSGILNLLGIVFLVYNGNTIFAISGTILASLALIMLFFGQRLAKDYVGAQSLVSYFILTLITLFLFCN
ncbi:MAG: DoxX family protein [Flavobacteriales bacterium]|nr:DoxX family protein [Flavobacteriales bacterium]|tara:strand:- start:1403 stop:1810 length:408 start_codon:yes stop_codon:yes gene_type:complete